MPSQSNRTKRADLFWNVVASSCAKAKSNTVRSTENEPCELRVSVAPTALEHDRFFDIAK